MAALRKLKRADASKELLAFDGVRTPVISFPLESCTVLPDRLRHGNRSLEAYGGSRHSLCESVCWHPIFLRQCVTGLSGSARTRLKSLVASASSSNSPITALSDHKEIRKRTSESKPLCLKFYKEGKGSCFVASKQTRACSKRALCLVPQ